MKNIIIPGPARVGKSMLASLLCKKYDLNYISGDSKKNAFINIYPELGYSSKNAIDNVNMAQQRQLYIDVAIFKNGTKGVKYQAIIEVKYLKKDENSKANIMAKRKEAYQQIEIYGR